MVIFRRQMSCNSVYVDESTNCSGSKKRVKSERGGCENSNNSIYKEVELQNETNNECVQNRILDTCGEDPCPRRCLQMRQHDNSFTQRKCNDWYFLALPPDIQIQIILYLHPQDVLSIACTDHNTRCLIDGSERTPSNVSVQDCNSTSTVLWFTLWNRDYGWVLREWKTGLEAVERSCASIANTTNDNVLCCPPILAATLNTNTAYVNNPLTEAHCRFADVKIPSMQEFYFSFSLIWQNYCIAGHSTTLSCLTGIHGHVFDITEFLPIHPGSPESLIMLAGGRDATSIFESVGHSWNARKIGWKKCALAVDLGCCSATMDGSVGGDRKKDDSLLFPNNTSRSCGVISSKNLILKNGRNEISSILPRNRSKPRVPGTQYKIRARFRREERIAQIKAVKTAAKEMGKLGSGDILGNVNVYFDPLCQRWKGWFMNREFSVVFLNDL